MCIFSFKKNHSNNIYFIKNRSFYKYVILCNKIYAKLIKKYYSTL